MTLLRPLRSGACRRPLAPFAAGAVAACWLAAVLCAAGPEMLVPPIKWETEYWVVQIDRRTGGMIELRSPKDLRGMNWIRPGGDWGTGVIFAKALGDGWRTPVAIERPAEGELDVVYRTPQLEIRVHRRFDAASRLRERYTFVNRTDEELHIGEGDLGILVPLFDAYPTDVKERDRRCNVHLWMAGDSSYINALRMSGEPQHLGLVVTEGALLGYSIHDRPQDPNDRGEFVVHPAPFDLAPHASHPIEWALFWHDGWPDFFAKARELPGFLQIEAEHFTVVEGRPLRLGAVSSGGFDQPQLLVEGRPVPLQRTPAGLLLADYPTSHPGELTVQLVAGSRRTLLRANVVAPPLELIRARVRFIIDHQQVRAPGQPLDGAYLVCDNEAGRIVPPDGSPDHGPGRERIGMGVLLALYLPRCEDEALRKKIRDSLGRFDAFVARELQDESGVVHSDLGHGGRPWLYNQAWMAQYHLAMYRATGDMFHLMRTVETIRAYYEHGGLKFYPIDLPVRDTLRALRDIGWKRSAEEMLDWFRRHADAIRARGTNYPAHELNYEQAIVASAVQIMLEVFLVTADPMSIDGAEKQIEGLLTFNGRQPDHRLHEVAIRHWDDAAMGRRHLYGDTLPQAWTSLTAVVYQLMSEATNEPAYAERAYEGFLNTLSLFSPDGHASCAYVYPLRINGEPGRFLDPWANDQDWALVNWMLYQPATLLAPLPDAPED